MTTILKATNSGTVPKLAIHARHRGAVRASLVRVPELALTYRAFRAPRNPGIMACRCGLKASRCLRT
jgi:hypothetical protein